MPSTKYAWLLINQYIGQWPPSELASMPLSKLYEWYDIAHELWDQEQKKANAQELNE